MEKIYACNSTEEVYECNRAKIIADVQSYFKCTQLQALNKILDSDINNPIQIKDIQIWIAYE
jgi:hypothetical protein